MRKIVCLIINLFLFIYVGTCFAAETITIATYYPAPYGVYKDLRLYPTTGFSSAAVCNAGGNEEGIIYYDIDEHQLLYCNGSNWQTLSGQDPYWQFIDNPGTDPDWLVTKDTSWNVGIQRQDPELRLSQGFGGWLYGNTCCRGSLLSKGTIDAGADLVTSGAGTRLFWWPRKGAFRAGYVNGNQWNSGNIGYDSVAMGYNTVASGLKSIAMGDTATASGPDSIAIGHNVAASGGASIALGSQSTVSTGYSIAIGHNLTIQDKPLDGITVDNAIMIGRGQDSTNRLLNEDKPNSLMIGFGGTTPLLFVGADPVGGANTHGPVGIRTSNLVQIGNRALFVNGAAAGTQPWSPPSDERLKKDIKPIPNALEKVMKLRGVNFHWKDPKTYAEGTKMGIIAQEAKDIIPEVVDKNGEYYSIQYDPIVALLVEAIKQQQQRIELLKARLEQEQ